MKLRLQPGQLPIVFFNLTVLATFSVIFYLQENTEFFVYLGVYIFFFIWILLSTRRRHYSNGLLWGLSLWALLHMCGGGVYLGGTKMYEIMLLPISETYSILKYDQFVHAFGFGVATVLMYDLIRPLLKTPLRDMKVLAFVVIMAGCGIGALNEMIEFFAYVTVEDNGVGSYVNNAIDLVANFIGASIAMVFLVLREKALTKTQ